MAGLVFYPDHHQLRATRRELSTSGHRHPRDHASDGGIHVAPSPRIAPVAAGRIGTSESDLDLTLALV